jgi:hypothetical protein
MDAKKELADKIHAKVKELNVLIEESDKESLIVEILQSPYMKPVGEFNNKVAVKCTVEIKTEF